MFAAPPARGVALPAAGASRQCYRVLPRAAALRWSCRSSALAGRSLQKVRFLLGAVLRFPCGLQKVSSIGCFDCADF